MKEKTIRVALLCMLALLVALGAYALVLRQNQSTYTETMRSYAGEFSKRLDNVRDKVLALPDADDAEYWSDMTENLHFQSVLGEARAILQVVAPIAYQREVYDVYKNIDMFQSAINYFTSDYLLYYYEYEPVALQKRIDQLKNGIRNHEGEAQ